jgi:hypothetical protein
VNLPTVISVSKNWYFQDRYFYSVIFERPVFVDLMDPDIAVIPIIAVALKTEVYRVFYFP